MSLDKQVVGVTFTQGLDTQTDKRLVLPGKMVELQNASLSERDSIQRRNGSTALVAGTAFRGVLARENELVTLGGVTIGSYSDSTGSIVTRGYTSNTTLETQAIVRNNLSQSYLDMATDGSVSCYVYAETNVVAGTNALRVTVRDESTGTVLLSPTGISGAGVCPRVIYADGAFFLFYMEAPNLRCRVILASAPTTLGSATTLRTDMSVIRGASVAALDVTTDGTVAYVIYSSNDATNSIRAVAVVHIGTTPSVAAGPANLRTAAAVPLANLHAVAIAWFSGTTLGVYALVDDGAAAGVRGINAGTVSTGMVVAVAMTQKDPLAPVNADMGVANLVASRNAAGTRVFVYADQANSVGVAGNMSGIRTFQIDSTNALTTGLGSLVVSASSTNGLNGPVIAGKSVDANGTTHLPIAMVEYGTGGVAFNQGAQSTWYLLDSSSRLAARAFAGTLGPNPSNTNYQLPPSTVALSSLVLATPVMQRIFLTLAGGTNISNGGYSRITWTINVAAPPVTASLGPLDYIASAGTGFYDGSMGTEAGFPYYPYGLTATSGGAGNVEAGTRQYVALYELIDAAGQRHQSAASLPVTYTNAGATTVTVVVPTLRMGEVARASVVSIAVFRTITTPAPGTIFYRVFTSVGGATAIAYPNSPSTASISFVDNSSDASVSANEVLYTTGGELPNDAPPPHAVICEHQQRLFINPSDDPFAFQYSQPWVSGKGPQWSQDLRGRVDSAGGTITGFASIDDKLIIFRPRAIGVLFGQGPTTSGAQNGYQLQDLPTDLGCPEPRSILVMPEGVIFKSTSKGWYRLGRDLQLQWIGQGVQAFDGCGVTSAVLLDTLKECRFTTADYIADALGNGVYSELVYNYDQKGPDGVGQWNTSTSPTSGPIYDAVWWPGGDAYVMASDTKIIKELPPVPVARTTSAYHYGDLAPSTTSGTIGGAAPVTNLGGRIIVIWRTGWLKPGDVLQGFQRVWRILLTGEVAGYPMPGTTLRTGYTAPAMSLDVWDSSIFTADVLLGLGLALGTGTANYEFSSDPYSIIDAHTIALSVPYNGNHNAGESVLGTRVFGARGTLAADFYFDGNETTPGFTTTFSDLSVLVNENTWEARIHMAIQKCEMVMVKVTQTPPSIQAQGSGYVDAGGGLNFSGLTMELGVKKGARKLPASKSG